MFDLKRYQEQLLQLHDHICPRQVLGLRMGELAGQLLGVALPQTDKRLFAFVESDGCFADGVMVATGCALGHRTMRLMDYGKVAVTMVDTSDSSRHAVRIHPHPLARLRAGDFVATTQSRWHTQLSAYQTMPVEELLRAVPVQLSVSMAAIISRPGIRAACGVCGEEIINQREVVRGAQTLCRVCAGDDGYYTAASPAYSIAALTETTAPTR